MSVSSKLTLEHQALLASFVAEETARGRRPRGVEHLYYGVVQFLAFVEERGVALTGLRPEDAYAYQGACIEKRNRSGEPYTTSAVASFVDAANAFCGYLVRAGKALSNPFESMRRVRVEKKIPEGILTERETDKLLAALKAWEGGSDLWRMKRRYLAHVVAELQYASGLRIAEVAALVPSDVDVERALVQVREGKGGLNRLAFLTDYACCVLELYMREARPALMSRMRAPDPERLFMVQPEYLTHAMSEELASACSEAGVKAIGSHGFRHALGYHLLRSGCPLRYIQAILGHRRIANTEVYTKVDVDDVKAVFDSCHPRAHG